MKIRISILILLSLTIVLLFPLLGCKKDLPLTLDVAENKSISAAPIGLREGADNYALITTSISTNNGMYNFPSYNEVEKVLESLDALLKDDEINTLSLTTLGYFDESDIDAPDEPVLEVFNRRFNISTLRQKCDEINRLEDLGLVEESEIDKVVIWDPVLGSIINQNNEVCIGNLVYKFLDDNQTLVFRADENLLNIVRNSSDPFSIQNQFNLFRIDARKPEDLDIYKKLEVANRGGGCMFDIDWSNDGNQFYFHSFGYFPIGGDVTWKIIDGNGVVLQTQLGFQTFNFLIPNFTVYPISVSIESEECDPHVEIFAQNPPLAGYNCATLNFDFEFTGNTSQRVVKFKIPANTPTLYWDFGDGNVETTLPTGAAGGYIIHTYPPDDEGEIQYTVCVYVQTENCENKVCKTIGAVGCGIKNKKFRKKDEYLIGVQGFKAKFALKNPLFGDSRIVVKLKHYNVNGILWTKQKADRLSLFLNASGNSSLGDLRYFTPNSNDGCDLTEENALVDKLNVSKIGGVRNLDKNSSMRKADIRCDFDIVETVIPETLLPPGFVNPITFSFKLGF